MIVFAPSVFLRAQTDFSRADARAVNAPESESRSVSRLSEYLCSPFDSDAEKARALYTWIALHIAYADSTNGNLFWTRKADIVRQTPEAVLRNRTAVCQGFSNLFCALATKAGIPCEIISGITKTPSGEVTESGHAWAAAKIGSEWRLFDPTWGEMPRARFDRSNFERYFMTSPEIMIENHLPDDPLWQLLLNPLSETQWRNWSATKTAAWARETPERPFQYADTLKTWIPLDSLRRLEASIRRIERFNDDNERVNFDLGRELYTVFIQKYALLDTVLGHLIGETSPASVDTNFLFREINAAEQYQSRAARFFQRVYGSDRRARINRFGEAPLPGIFDKLRGDVRLALFNQSLPADMKTQSRRQLQTLQQRLEQTEQYYVSALRQINAQVFPEQVEAMLQRRGWMHLMIAYGYSAWIARQCTDGEMDENITADIDAAARYYDASEQFTRQMTPNSLVSNLMLRRLQSIEASRFQLRYYRRLNAHNRLVGASNRLANDPKAPAQDLEDCVSAWDAHEADLQRFFRDTLARRADKQDPVIRNTIQQMQIHIYEAQLQQAYLQQKLLIETYNAAVRSRNVPQEAENIKKIGRRSRQAYQNAQKSLQQVEWFESGARKSQSESIQRNLQTIQDILGRLP